jgi:nucleoside 2-deoxyribosyltransferase
LICERDKISRKRLRNSLEGNPLVEELYEAESIKSAIEIIGEKGLNAIFIDPIELGLEVASNFIFKVREMAPHIVFCLHLEFREMQRLARHFFAEERRRFEHYYKLDKELEADGYAKEVSSIVAFCVSDVRLFSEVERLRQQRGIYLESLPPPDLQESIRKFYQVYPAKTRTAFVIMRLGKEKTQEKIYSFLKDNLKKFEITAVRADEKHFAPSLIQNVHTFLHCCTFGVAVFERMESDTFNPNVAYEVGFLYALRKPVFLLKDQSLKTLHSDLLGNLYVEFDTHDLKRSLRAAVRRWIAAQAFGNGEHAE